MRPLRYQRSSPQIGASFILCYMAEGRPDIPAELKRAVLVEAGHRCAIPSCRATTTEIAHISPWRDQRVHKFENLIALCPNCHTRFDAGEIDRKSMLMYKARLGAMSNHIGRPWPEHSVTLDTDLEAQPASIADLYSDIETLDLWDAHVAGGFLPRILLLGDSQRVALVRKLSKILSVRSDDDNVRWNAALIVEFLVKWDPQKVPAGLLLTMTTDPFFSVRTSAAVSYYHLAASSPDHVPIEVLGRMASVFEDWYVMTPATSALLRLARTRPAAVEVLASAISHENVDARDHAASALERLAKADPAALRDDIADRMIASGDQRLVKVGETWKQVIESHRAMGETLDYYL
jgi:hypothetical protein